MRYIKQLQDDLAYCVERRILTAEAARSVVQALEQRQGPSPWRASLVLGILSGVCVVAGLALIVSHNWDKIPALVKVLSFLILYFGVGRGAIVCEERYPRAAITLQMLWLFLPLVGIGLYAQVFQLSGNPARPFLVWLALISPMVLVRPSPVAARIHVLASLGIVFGFNFWRGNELSLVRGYSHLPVSIPASWSAWAWTAGLLALAHGVNRRFIPERHQHVLWIGFGVWLVSLSLARTPFEFNTTGGHLLIFAACSVAILVVTQALLRLPHRGFFWLAWISSVYATTFFWHSRAYGTPDATIPAAVYASVLGVLALLLILVIDRENDAIPRFWLRLWQAGLAASVIIPSVAVFSTEVNVLKGLALAANVLLAGIGISLIAYGSRIGRTAMINGGCAVVFVLIVTRFLDVFGSFLRSGAGMMAAGLLLAGLAYALNRGRQTLVETSGKESL